MSDDRPIPPKPLPSASILLAREGRGGPEVLLARRNYQIDFFSGALVFPGGKVDDDDLNPGWAGRTDGGHGELDPYAIAAVRETFEESGLLLARPENARGDDAELVGAEIADRLAPHREAVDRREQSFFELVADAGLVLALDRLVRFAHWITPEFMPKRFDTQFFLARAPEGQVAAHDGREAMTTDWLTPAEAMARADRGEATVLFPTRLNLERLAEADGIEDALSRAAAAPPVPVMPRGERDAEGKRWLVIPEDAGYRTTRAPAPKRQ